MQQQREHRRRPSPAWFVLAGALNLCAATAVWLWAGYESSNVWKRGYALLSWEAIRTDVINEKLGLTGTDRELRGGVNVMGPPNDNPDVVLEYLDGGLTDGLFWAAVAFGVVNAGLWAGALVAWRSGVAVEAGPGGDGN